MRPERHDVVRSRCDSPRGGDAGPGGWGQMVLETIVEEGLSLPVESIAVTTK